MRCIGDSHVHTKESDGVYSVEEVVAFAIERGLGYICFTDHYPLPFALLEMDKRARFTDAYIQEIMAAKEKYRGRIDICLGAEFDWLEPYTEWTAKEIAKHKYDYILGSIHWVYREAILCPVDEGEEAFMRSAQAWGGIEAFVREYYRQLRLLIGSGLFDGVGHFDLIKIYNKSECLFTEASDWYKRAVTETLDVLVGSAMCMEINTNGWYKKIGVQYPSEWILKEAVKRSIPITLSSDGHRGEGIGRDLVRAWELAKYAGYDLVVRFMGRKMVVVKPT